MTWISAFLKCDMDKCMDKYKCMDGSISKMVKFYQVLCIGKAANGKEPIAIVAKL